MDAVFDVLLDGLNSYSALLSGRQRLLRSLLQPRACRLTVSISYFLTGLLRSEHSWCPSNSVSSSQRSWVCQVSRAPRRHLSPSSRSPTPAAFPTESRLALMVTSGSQNILATESGESLARASLPSFLFPRRTASPTGSSRDPTTISGLQRRPVTRSDGSLLPVPSRSSSCPHRTPRPSTSLRV